MEMWLWQVRWLKEALLCIKNMRISGVARCSMLNAGYVGLGRNRSISRLFWFEQSLNLFEQLGDIWGKSNVYQGMGRIYLDQA